MQAIAKLTNQLTSGIQKSELPEALNQPGRLLFEVENRKESVLAELELAITIAGKRMGLRTATESELAKDYVTYVQMNYKTAYLSDLLRSLELASIGEIEKNNQLNVLSVLNLCQWFKIYWDDHRSKHLPKNETKELPEMSEESKTAEVRKSLENWLSLSAGERILMSAYFYGKLWDWGILNLGNLTEKARRDAYNERLAKYAVSIPGSILNDPLKRKTARQMIDQCTDEKGVFTPPVSYGVFAKNDLHLLVLEECRNKAMNDFVFKYGKEQILAQFDLHHATT